MISYYSDKIQKGDNPKENVSQRYQESKSELPKYAVGTASDYILSVMLHVTKLFGEWSTAQKTVNQF
jgi:hypothetical protein